MSFININCYIADVKLVLHCNLGFSLMQCLKSSENNEKITDLTENIAATCGGNMSCSTCMVRIDKLWISKLDSPSENENIFIDMFLESNNIYDYEEGEYRLSCQIEISEKLENLTIYLINNN